MEKHSTIDIYLAKSTLTAKIGHSFTLVLYYRPIISNAMQEGSQTGKTWTKNFSSSTDILNFDLAHAEIWELMMTKWYHVTIREIMKNQWVYRLIRHLNYIQLFNVYIVLMHWLSISMLAYDVFTLVRYNMNKKKQNREAHLKQSWQRVHFIKLPKSLSTWELYNLQVINLIN